MALFRSDHGVIAWCVFFLKGITRNSRCSDVSKHSGKLFIPFLEASFPAARTSPLFVIVLIRLITAHQLNFPPKEGRCSSNPMSAPPSVSSREDSSRPNYQFLNTIDRINGEGYKNSPFHSFNKKVFRISIITPGDLAACHQEPGAV